MALAFDHASTAGAAPAGMIWIPGGTFTMGSDHHYPEEAPAHRVKVDGFWIDETPVTNRKFMAFVTETGHVTMAEKAPVPRDYPGARPEMLRAGSLLFVQPKSVGGAEISQWWTFKFGATWRKPLGGLSDLRGKLDHPVVHVAWSDAKAYADWAGLDIPTEAEWEFSARGGLEDTEFAWGEELMPGGKAMANTWQGTFPTHSTKPKGHERTSPVRSFPPNGYGLYDMIGNAGNGPAITGARGIPNLLPRPAVFRTTRGAAMPRRATIPRQPQIRVARRVLKGGSHLCAPNYCRRYLPAARHAEPEDTSTSHVGFRCIKRAHA
ncbi:UNVERIFIED_ORG: formylglycine-generating enzyme required for sulfatase activity [Rhizobium aethiopicum]